MDHLPPENAYPVPLNKLVDSMHRIKRVSAAILREKMEDTAVAMSDMNAKRDIMTLLVRARKADLDKDKGVYAMSDEVMMAQVVSLIHIKLLICKCGMLITA
jgi:hypothetical protein